MGRRDPSASAPPRLLALATAVPKHVLRQTEVRAHARAIFGNHVGEIERLEPVYVNAGIDTRYSCVPLDWYTETHGWTDRNELYLEHAVELLARATEEVLAATGLSARDIDAVVAVSTSGIATPSLDALMIDRLGLRDDIRRLPVFGLGCGGGVIGLGRASDLARAHPGETVLLLVVEPCGLTFRRSDGSTRNIVATALFGDGAAAALISTRGVSGPRIGACGEYTWPNSRDVMGWGVEDDGLRVIFSPAIPWIVRDGLRAALDRFLAKHRVALADIDHFLCHPGGAKVLDALEDVLELGRGALAHSRATLRDFGNMSAVTVLFVLARALRNGGIGRRALLSALGPGFTAGFLLLENEGALAP